MKDQNPKKISNSDMRSFIGFAAFFGLLIFTAKNGVYLADVEYMRLFTIMLAGFMAGGGK